MNNDEKKSSVSNVSPAPGEQDSTLSAPEQGYGMPNFGFPEDHDSGSHTNGDDHRDTIAKVEAGLDIPLDAGTGWENGEAVNADISPPDDMDIVDDTLPDLTDFDSEPAKSEATVMQFPGSAIPRPNELEPSELLRGSGSISDDLFSAPTADYSAHAVDLGLSGSDSIASAVQSALQNVYGDEGETPSEPAAPDFGQFSVAESLRQDAAAQAYWHGDEDNETEPEEENNTETVLDYLYSNRRSGPERLQEPNSASSNSYSGFGATNPDQGGAYYGRQQDARGPHGYDDDTDWSPPSFVTSSSSEPGQYPAPMTTANPESLAVGSPDSSHLLGAAGLGLIGGIALAGVLAVFVFNSFVEENDPTISVGATPPKVIERLSGDGNADGTVITARGSAETTIPGPNTPAAVADSIAETRAAALDPESAQPSPVVNVTPSAPEKPLNALDAAGLPGTVIPLEIKMSDEVSKEAALLSLKGLTENCKLSTGIDVGAGQWLLPTARLNTLTVTPPETLKGTFEIEVQLLKDDAQTPVSDPVSFNLVIGAAPQQTNEPEAAEAAPAATLQETNEQATQLVEVAETTAEIDTDPLTQLLIRDGNKLMREGDILGARRLYEQAAANGNPEAALAMGRSYDPSYFEKLPVQTGKPDPATALQWYKQALSGGLVTARVKIDGLKQWLEQ